MLQQRDAQSLPEPFLNIKGNAAFDVLTPLNHDAVILLKRNHRGGVYIDLKIGDGLGAALMRARRLRLEEANARRKKLGKPPIRRDD